MGGFGHGGLNDMGQGLNASSGNVMGADMFMQYLSNNNQNSAVDSFKKSPKSVISKNYTPVDSISEASINKSSVPNSQYN